MNSAWNTSIQFFSFFIIFPIGAALVGALAVSGLYLGRRIFNLPFKKFYLWIALVGGLVSFFAVTYIDYNYWKSGALEYANVSISELTEDEKKEVDEALKSASKKGTGESGFPDFTAKVKDFLIVIEDKSDLSKHCKLDSNSCIDLDNIKSIINKIRFMLKL